MINCPYCGTPNRRGSRYCSNCGQHLEAISAITCSACEKLNPPGSTFCAFCGALLVSGASVKSVASHAAPRREETGKPVQEGIETPIPRRELPPWLYEQPAAQPERISPPTAVYPPREEKNRYLRGIQGVLPSVDNWLASSMQQEIASTSNQPPSGKTARRLGCLTLGLVTLLGSIGLALVSASSPHWECNGRGDKR